MFLSRTCVMSLAPQKRFVTTRDEESMPGSSDDVFLAGEESQSFKQQVTFVKTAKRNGSYAGVPGDHWRRSLYSSTGWPPQASIAAYFRLLSDQVSYTFEILFDQYCCNQMAEELVNSNHADQVCQLLWKGRTAWSSWWGFKPLLQNTWPIF